MIKSEFIAELTTQHGDLSERETAECVNLLLDYITDALVLGRRVEARGFGSFSVNYRRPRLAHNPKTLTKLEIPAKRSIHFKPGKDLRDRVNLSRKDTPILEDVHEED